MSEPSAAEQAANAPAAQAGSPDTFTTSFLREVSQSMSGPQKDLPLTSTLAALISHGGFQLLKTPGRMMKRLQKHIPTTGEEATALRAVDGTNEADRTASEIKTRKEKRASDAAVALKTQADKFFQKLCPDVYYGIPSSLMSHLAFPYEGRAYTGRNEIEAGNPKIPAAFTFVGQFVDHDLTFNGLNLFDNAVMQSAPELASPFLDLDSVYYRSYANAPDDEGLKGELKKHRAKIFDGCLFRLRKLGKNAYDVPRFEDSSAPDRVGSAWIYDPRNDENQLVLHIHLLIMRLHNKLAETEAPASQNEQCIHALRKKVVRIWQSVILNDYLPRVCQPSVLNEVRAPGYVFHYRPNGSGVFQMPHEFGIGFRFGHSMLRSSYKLNSGNAIPLFDNRSTVEGSDLRGSVKLTAAHVIDWDIFLPPNESQASASLLIDSHVSPVVFDLPESTIPDDIKTDGNLAKRNLDRSRSIELGCGEDVATCLGVTDVLSPEEVEPDVTKHPLFQMDVNVYETVNGKITLVQTDPFKGHKDTHFKTPLWYYILREAEVREEGIRLGALGSRLVAEVVLQAINNGHYAYDYSDSTPLLGGKTGSQIKLRDLIDFVHES